MCVFYYTKYPQYSPQTIYITYSILRIMPNIKHDKDKYAPFKSPSEVYQKYMEDEIMKIWDIMENPNRIKILELVKKGRYSITDIAKKIKLSYKRSFDASKTKLEEQWKQLINLVEPNEVKIVLIYNKLIKHYIVQFFRDKGLINLFFWKNTVYTPKFKHRVLDVGFLIEYEEFQNAFCRVNLLENKIFPKDIKNIRNNC